MKANACLALWALPLALLAIFISPLAYSRDATGNPEVAFIKRAVQVEKRLWVLDESGRLSLVDIEAQTRTPDLANERVLDLCVRMAQPLAAAIQAGADKWVLFQRGTETWSQLASGDLNAERLLAMDCTADEVSLLTSRRLIMVGPAGEHSVALSADFNERARMASIAATLATKDGFYIGLNAGEWGGGLVRIDRQTGAAKQLEQRGDKPYTGLLVSGLDPVTGLVTSPWNDDCILASIGLVHFFPRGRIVEICGLTFREVYTAPIGTKGRNLGSIAFFGLARRDAQVWAVGHDGLYTIGHDGGRKSVVEPDYASIGGLAVSVSDPAFTLVLTMANQRHSLSGNTPLLVPRY